MRVDTYNNIGFSLIAFLSIIRKMEQVEYSKALLILPLVLHNPLIDYLKKDSVKVKGMEDLILSKTEYFLNYNERYLNFLSLSLNTIIFAESMNFISIKNNQIIPIKKEIEKIDFSIAQVGKRINKVYKASDNIVKVLDEDVAELYFKLRIEL